MPRNSLNSLLLLAIVVLLTNHPSLAASAAPDPTQWSAVMRAFEIGDIECPPPPNEIVFIGSSSIALWKTIGKDIAPLRVINRGFGGSTMGDAVYWLDAIALKYHPRAVVVYEGDNDTAAGSTPEEVLINFERLISRLHAASSHTRVYFLAIKPSILRWSHWSQMARANQLIRARCEQESRCHFIDVASPMIDQGRPREDIFAPDKLHMNAKGYDLWTSIIRPALLERETTNN